MNKNIRQKLIIAAALMIAATASAFAQGNGLAGINEACCDHLYVRTILPLPDHIVR